MNKTFTIYDTEKDFEEYKQYLKDSEEEGYEPTDQEVWDYISDCSQSEWDEISHDLDNFFKQGHAYICKGQVGRWTGRHDGGFLFHSFDELRKAWRDCDILRLSEDKRGRFFIDCAHHDGSNHYEVRRLTERGERYNELHQYDMSDIELHEKLFEHPYSQNLNYLKFN